MHIECNGELKRSTSPSSMSFERITALGRDLADVLRAVEIRFSKLEERSAEQLSSLVHTNERINALLKLVVALEEAKMPKGKKHRFTEKEDREASHVAASMKKKGMSAKKAKSVGYATVNKRKSK